MLHHVGIEVAPADVERTIELWELLGFERVEPPPTLREYVWLEREGTQVHLMPTEVPTVPPRGHTAVVADFERTLGDLAEHAFEVERRREHWGVPRAVVLDPGGHRIELMAVAPAGGSAVTAGPFIAIVGSIATGKSGLVERLSERLGATPLLEDVSSNPYFDRFYDEPQKWAFQSQVAFAADSLRRHVQAAAGGSVVQDRTVYETVDVFGRLLHEHGHLTSADLRVLSELRECAATLPRQPDVLLRLHAPVSTIMDRVAERDRPAERHLSVDYLAQLERLYDAFIEHWTQCPVVKMDTTENDFRDPAQLEELARSLTATPPE